MIRFALHELQVVSKYVQLNNRIDLISLLNVYLSLSLHMIYLCFTSCTRILLEFLQKKCTLCTMTYLVHVYSCSIF